MKPHCHAVVHFFSSSKAKSLMLSYTAYLQTLSNPARTQKGRLLLRLSPLNAGLTIETVPECCNRNLCRTSNNSRSFETVFAFRIHPEFASND